MAAKEPFDSVRQSLFLRRLHELTDKADVLSSRVIRGEYRDHDLEELAYILHALRNEFVGNDTRLAEETGVSGRTIAATYSRQTRPKYTNFMKMLHGAQQLLLQLSSQYSAHVRLGDSLSEMELPRRQAQEADGEPALLAKNRSDILRFSNAIIVAFEEALAYEPLRHHNRPPPELWIENSHYLDEIRKLTDELRRLNATLDRIDNSHLRAASQKVSRIGAHFDEFFNSYAGALGKGAAGLTIAAVTALLYQAGVGAEILIQFGDIGSLTNE